MRVDARRSNQRATRSSLLLLAAVAALLVGFGIARVPTAEADGDPASDVLVNVNVYLPAPPVAPPLSTLVQRVRLVNLSGYRIKVAVIETESDLGAITSLFGHPQEYAKFLGLELSLIYKGNLLIVMPGGFGFFHDGEPGTVEQTALSSTPLDASSRTALINSAIAAVHSLVTAAGPNIAVTSAASLGARTVVIGYQMLSNGSPQTVARGEILSRGKTIGSAAVRLHVKRGVSFRTLRVPIPRTKWNPGLTACTSSTTDKRTSHMSCLRIRRA